MTSRPVAIDEQGTADLKVDSRQVGTTDGVPNVRQIVAIGAGDSPNDILDTAGGSLPVVAGKGDRVLLDYDIRTDGLPVYVSIAPQGTATSAAAWRVIRLTWDGDDRLTDKQEIGDAVHDDRASLGWT